MTKRRKSRRQRAREQRKKASPEFLRSQGIKAFQAGDYEMAVAAWRRIPKSKREPDLTAIFAETCFRLGLKGHLDRLRQAVNLAPDEPRYLYHLALAHHRAGRPKEAEPLYRRALEQEVQDGEGDFVARAAHALGLLLLEAGKRPSRDRFWKRLEKAPDGSSLAETGRRLAWAESLTFGRSAPSGPAPGPLWAALAARQAGDEDPIPIDPGDLPDAIAPVAHCHLGARAWEREQIEKAFYHWRAAYKAGLDFQDLRDNLFAAARPLATERLKAGDVEEALEAARVGLAMDPDDNGLQAIAGQAHFRLGHAAALADDWDEAYEHWLDVLDVGADRSRRLVINMALAEEQERNWQEAAELWREAVRRRPRKDDHPDALTDEQVAQMWRHVAENYQRSGWVGEAMTTFRNALKWAPEDADLRKAYTDMLIDDGRLEAAGNQLETLLEQHPDDIEVLELQAQVLDGRGYIYAAIRIWKEILERQPDHPSAARQIARHYERIGDSRYHWGWLQEAMENFKEGLTYAPDDGMLLASVGMCHLDLGDTETAYEFFERARTAEPTNPDVYLTPIKCWIIDDELEEADKVLAHARQALPMSPAFFLDLVDFCYKNYHQDLARDYLAQARDLAGENTNALLAVADVAGRNGEYFLAKEVVEQILELDPDNAMAYLIQGLVMVSLDNLGEARRSWDKAEEIARQTNNQVVLMTVNEMRFLYDPDHGPSMDFLSRMFGPAFFD